jgi:FMN phosphatase YigB (HAD superfamily)
MRVFNLPIDPKAIIFDLDNTLYTNQAYAEYQEKALVIRLAAFLGLGVDEAAKRIEAARVARAAAGDGKTSLGNIFAALGVDVGTSVRWREEEFRPGEWLAPDPKLDETLGILATRLSLALVTNNPCSVGVQSLQALGVRERFSSIVGLDSTFKSKPAVEPFIRAAELLGAPINGCVSVGDRFDVDLAPALEIGMGAILIDGVEDVYRLVHRFRGIYPCSEEKRP